MTIAVWCIVVLGATIFFYYRLTRGIVSRRRPDQAPRSQFGIIAVDGAQHGLGTQLRADGVDIIFVHGLGSNPDTTWRARPVLPNSTNLKVPDPSDEHVCWVTDFLLDDLPLATRRKTRIFFHNHDSYWQREAARTRLWNLADNMLHQVRDKIRRTPDERRRALIFVGHSYGGLIIKQTLVRAKGDPAFQDIACQTKGILFLGTPHRGSSFTRIGSIVASLLGPLGSNRSILNEIAYDALNLQDLHEQFTVTMGEGLYVCNFYEERETHLVDLGVVQWSKFCVEEQSAKYFGSSRRVQNVGLAVDHSGLNKFRARTAEYCSIRDKLLELLPPAPHDIYSVPADRVETYTSRAGLSRRIKEMLPLLSAEEDSHGPSDYRVLIIHGMGGVGKTQLAINYVKEHKAQYSAIFWINAHTLETVRLSFERLAMALDLTANSASTPDSRLQDSPLVKEALRWFSERDEADPKWLVVIDNADDTTWNVADIIPRGRHGHVIVTSQPSQSLRFLEGVCTRLEVGTMAPSEARALLKRHVGLLDQEVSTDVDDLCDQVAEHLGCLALATDLAGAYLAEQPDFHDREGEGDAVLRDETARAVLRQYLVDYDQHQDTLLKWRPFYQLSPYEKTVWTVWDTSFTTIEKKYPEGCVVEVLTFLAYFDQGTVQEELFRLASEGWQTMVDLLRLSNNNSVPGWLGQLVAQKGGQWDNFHYRQAIQRLKRYGLLQPLDSNWAGTTMHGLVRWRASKARQGDDTLWARWVRLFMIAAVCQTNHDKGRPQFRRHVIAHLVALGSIILDYDYEMNVVEEVMASLWQELAKPYYDEGRWTEAEKLQLQVMETRKRLLGEEHPDTLTSIANLASTLWNQGRWKEAEELQLQVMEIRKRVLGEEHPDTLTSIANLATTLWNQGRWKEAEELQLQVMEISKRVLGEEHSSTLTSIANLASTLWNQGRWKEAEELELQVMEIGKRVLGEEHPSTLTSMKNLAFTWRSQGRYAEALTLMVRCAELLEHRYGLSYPGTVSAIETVRGWQAPELGPDS